MTKKDETGKNLSSPKQTVSEPCRAVKDMGDGLQQQMMAAERARRSRWLWRLAVIAATCALMVFSGSLAVSVKDGSRAAMVITAMMVLSTLLLLFRLLQVWISKDLAPAKDSGDGSNFHYMEWRKAVQKPLESVGSLGLFATFLFVMSQFDASRSDIESIRSGIFALVAWAPVPGLVGSTGSDIVAWRLKQFPNRQLGLMLPPARWFLVKSWVFPVAAGVGVLSGLGGHVPDAKAPEMRCTPRTASASPSAKQLYACEGEGELVPQGVTGGASEQPWPRYECSAPPATRDASGAFPTAPPTYTCNKR